MDDFLCFGLVENWKADDIFNTLAGKIVKHCVVKKISPLVRETAGYSWFGPGRF